MEKELSSEKTRRQKILSDVFSFEINGKEASFVPDAVVALSGGLVERTNARGEHLGFKAPSYSQMDNNGLISGGKARLLAVAEVHRDFPRAIIVTNSRDTGSSTRPSHAEIYAKALISKGVPAERIVTEEDSVATVDELFRLCELAQQAHWKIVAVVTNDYHIERVQLIFRELENLAAQSGSSALEEIVNFKLRGGLIIPVSAEEILFLRNHRYRNLVARVKELSEYQVRVAAEQRGIIDLASGRYRQGPANK